MTDAGVIGVTDAGVIGMTDAGVIGMTDEWVIPAKAGIQTLRSCQESAKQAREEFGSWCEESWIAEVWGSTA